MYIYICIFKGRHVLYIYIYVYMCISVALSLYVSFPYMHIILGYRDFGDTSASNSCASTLLPNELSIAKRDVYRERATEIHMYTYIYIYIIHVSL